MFPIELDAEPKKTSFGTVEFTWWNFQALRALLAARQADSSTADIEAIALRFQPECEISDANWIDEMQKNSENCHKISQADLNITWLIGIW